MIHEIKIGVDLLEKSVDEKTQAAPARNDDEPKPLVITCTEDFLVFFKARSENMVEGGTVEGMF